MTKPMWGNIPGNLDIDEKGKCPSCGLVAFDEDGPCCGAMWNKTDEELEQYEQSSGSAQSAC
jgi:hypothetical protein